MTSPPFPHLGTHPNYRYFMGKVTEYPHLVLCKWKPLIRPVEAREMCGLIGEFCYVPFSIYQNGVHQPEASRYIYMFSDPEDTTRFKEKLLEMTT